MEAEKYHKMLEAIAKMSAEFKENVKQRSRPLNRQDFLLGAFNISPLYTPFFKHKYYKTDDQAGFQTKCREDIRRFIQGYVYPIGKKYKDEIDSLAAGLSSGGMTFGDAVLTVPEEKIEEFKKNGDSRGDGKEDIIEILSIWENEILTNEAPVGVRPKPPVRPPVPVSINPDPDECFWEDDDYVEEEDGNKIHFDDDGSNWSYNENH